jgi:hypothetical protein
MNKNDEEGNVEDGDDITSTITINMHRNININMNRDNRRSNLAIRISVSELDFGTCRNRSKNRFFRSHSLHCAELGCPSLMRFDYIPE